MVIPAKKLASNPCSAIPIINPTPPDMAQSPVISLWNTKDKIPEETNKNTTTNTSERINAGATWRCRRLIQKSTNNRLMVTVATHPPVSHTKLAQNLAPDSATPAGRVRGNHWCACCPASTSSKRLVGQKRGLNFLYIIFLLLQRRGWARSGPKKKTCIKWTDVLY